jgi:hypothetical protein
MKLSISEMPGGPIQATFIYDKSSVEQTELAKKVEANIRLVLEKSVVFAKCKHADYREPLTHTDINIHLSQPFYVTNPWSHVNVIVKGKEWIEESHAPYMPAFDVFLDETSASEPFEILSSAVKQMITLVDERRPKKGHYHCPPVLLPEDCPPISVITPTYNRRELIDIALHNLMSTDYPQDKIEWVVVEDNEDSSKMASDKLMSFQVNCPAIKIKYIPLTGRVSVGEKRDIAIEHATNDIILFMDDDDHYPVTSFRRRVAWLLKGPRADRTTIAACTTIALYDLKRGVSAVNVPPVGLSLGKRISEATLTFKKSAWLERKFGDVAIAEGEAWIAGREDQVIELMPQQIIVAFSHDKNLSSRRIPPADASVSCFWGFPKEYLIFIHKLAGVQVEDTSSSGKSKRS